MEKITEEEALKVNIIRLVKHHKKTCEGEDCNISLILVARVMEKAGLSLNRHQLKDFV